MEDLPANQRLFQLKEPEYVDEALGDEELLEFVRDVLCVGCRFLFLLYLLREEREEDRRLIDA